MSVPSTHSILLSHTPPPEEMGILVREVHAFLNCGDFCYLYCLHEGVRSIYGEAIQKLRQIGLKLIGCAYGAEKRGLPIDDSAVFGGLGMLSDLLQHSDTFASFPYAPRATKQARGFLVRPRQEIPSMDDLFEIYRVAAGLSSHINSQISIQITRPIPEELLHHADFLHFKEICNEQSVLLLLNKDDFEEHIPLEI